MSRLESISNDKWLAFLSQLTAPCEEIALHYFQKQNLSVLSKDDKSLVSEADLKIEEVIREISSQTYPELAVLGEEYGITSESCSARLIVDPIDGTSNFVRGIPFFASLLAIEIHQVVQVGMVFSPATKEKWWASKGKGSFYNGKPIQVSKVNQIEKSQAFYGSLFGREARGDRQKLLTLLSKTHRQRGFGDYLMHTMVAMGCGEWAVDFGLKPWDLAPLGIIIEESGGKISSCDGSTFSPYKGEILSSNGCFHDLLVQGLS